MILRPSLRRCALGSEIKRIADSRIWIFLLLIVWTAIVLNYPGYLIERTGIVHRTGVPCLLFGGLLGSIGRMRKARGAIVLRAVGWIAIIWFIPAILYSTPDLEHSAPEFRGFSTLWRVTTTSLLFLSLIYSYWTLRVGRNKEKEY